MLPFANLAGQCLDNAHRIPQHAECLEMSHPCGAESNPQRRMAHATGGSRDVSAPPQQLAQVRHHYELAQRRAAERRPGWPSGPQHRARHARTARARYLGFAHTPAPAAQRSSNSPPDHSSPPLAHVHRGTGTLHQLLSHKRRVRTAIRCRPCPSRSGPATSLSSPTCATRTRASQARPRQLACLPTTVSGAAPTARKRHMSSHGPPNGAGGSPGSFLATVCRTQAR